ncbi:MAG: transglutaminase-like domain-containing protein [Marinilabiliales bacterium]|nr:transglutaminase-like domain-containing protein [Marinilabiliales bacterium]
MKIINRLWLSWFRRFWIGYDMDAKDATLDALILLLDDQDEMVYQSVKEKLLSFGSGILPKLETSLDAVRIPEQHRRLEQIIFHLKRVQLIDKMRDWISSDNRSLLDGWLIVSSIHHPNLSKERIERIIQKLHREIWLEISESMTSLEKVSVLNHILFSINQFSVAESETASIDLLVIDKILFSKTGDVFALSILYLILARTLHIDLLPVILANKLLLVYEDKLAATLAFGGGNEKYLYYINVAHRGAVISPKEVQFLYDRSQKYGKLVTSVESDLTLLRKLLSLMYLIYTHEGDEEKLLLAENMLELME